MSMRIFYTHTARQDLREIYEYKHAGTVLCAICFRCHGDGSLNTDVSCTKDSMVEHIVHIDGVTGSCPVATIREPNRKVRLVLYIEEMDTENRPHVFRRTIDLSVSDNFGSSLWLS